MQSFNKTGAHEASSIPITFQNTRVTVVIIQNKKLAGMAGCRNAGRVFGSVVHRIGNGAVLKRPVKR